MSSRLSWCRLLATVHLPAQVQVHPLFGDHMVLQQGQKVPVWGTASILEFDQVHGGLVARDPTLVGFEIAGGDKTFHEARAEVHGDTVVVESESVSKPVAVRYAWQDTATASLYNKDRLPASPFRSDDWPGVTAAEPGSPQQRPPRRHR